MPHGVMSPRQLIQNELRPARQAIFSPGVPSHTSLSGAQIPAFMASARCRNSSSVKRSLSQWTLQAAASRQVKRSLRPVSASSRRTGGNIYDAICTGVPSSVAAA